MEDVNSFSPEEWQEWRDSRGTREFYKYLDDYRQHLLESLPELVNDIHVANQVVGKLQFVDDIKKAVIDKITGG